MYLLTAGSAVNSGNATEMTPDDWEDIRQAVRERIAKHKGSNQG
ncbi:hypothetical protein [Nostoc sp.]